MTRLKRLGLMTLAAAIVLIGSEIGSQLAVPGIHSTIPEAEAVVGRPLTPVSVGFLRV